MTDNKVGWTRDLRITGPLESVPVDIANSWGSRLLERLRERYSGRFTVDWTEDKEARTLTPPALRHWLTIRRESSLQGRVALSWDRAQPEWLRIRTEVASLPEPGNRLKPVLDILEWVLGIAAFGSWIWFVAVDWRRVWNRVSTFAGGYDATHATKLEVFWLVLGWALSPVVAIFLVELVRAWTQDLASAWQRRRVRAFNGQDLDGSLEAIIQVLLQDTAQDPKVCLALGQAHVGQPHPVHANLVWAANGQYHPAEGFTWASEDPDSLVVVRKDA